MSKQYEVFRQAHPKPCGYDHSENTVIYEPNLISLGKITAHPGVDPFLIASSVFDVTYPVLQEIK